MCIVPPSRICNAVQDLVRARTADPHLVAVQSNKATKMTTATTPFCRAQHTDICFARAGNGRARAARKICCRLRDMRRIYFPHPIIVALHTRRIICIGVQCHVWCRVWYSGNTNEFHLFIENLLENFIILISAGELYTSAAAANINICGHRISRAHSVAFK